MEFFGVGDSFRGPWEGPPGRTAAVHKPSLMPIREQLVVWGVGRTNIKRYNICLGSPSAA